MMKNYWYTSRYDEILIDLDGKESGKDKLVPCLSRLRAVVESRELPAKSVWLFPSPSRNHYHIFIRLLPGEPFSAEQKTAFQLYLFSDVFRTCCNLMRSAKNQPFPDLLITPLNLKKKFGFYRFHDASCNCETKHSLEIMESCPAAKLLRNDYAAVILFPKPMEPGEFFSKKFGRIYNRD
jgi:hypothetical protein